MTEHVTFIVKVDLDPTLGGPSTQFEHAQRWVSQALTDRIGHFNPVVNDTVYLATDLTVLIDKIDEVIAVMAFEGEVSFSEKEGVVPMLRAISQQLAALSFTLDNQPF